MVRLLIYVLIETKPDSAYPVSEISQFVTNSRMVYPDAIISILGYINGKSDLDLVFHQDSTKFRLTYIKED